MGRSPIDVFYPQQVSGHSWFRALAMRVKIWAKSIYSHGTYVLASSEDASGSGGEGPPSSGGDEQQKQQEKDCRPRAVEGPSSLGGVKSTLRRCGTAEEGNDVYHDVTSTTQQVRLRFAVATHRRTLLVLLQ